MYHLIMVAALITGGTKEIPQQYYETKAECLNNADKIPHDLRYDKNFCLYHEDKWFPDKDIIKKCKENVDVVSSAVGKCVKEE